jgi:hypothetical protein
LEALKLVEFGATVIVSVPITADAFVTLIGSGFGVQVMPTVAADVAVVVDVQVTLTAPANPPLGVAVMVEVALPAAVLAVVPVRVKLPVGAVTEKKLCPEVPPPFGFVTVTGIWPGFATSAAKIAADKLAASVKVVVLATPPKFTTDPFTKFVPLTCKVNAPEPAATLVGERFVIAGAAAALVNV